MKRFSSVQQILKPTHSLATAGRTHTCYRHTQLLAYSRGGGGAQRVGGGDGGGALSSGQWSDGRRTGRVDRWTERTSLQRKKKKNKNAPGKWSQRRTKKVNGLQRDSLLHLLHWAFQEEVWVVKEGEVEEAEEWGLLTKE